MTVKGTLATAVVLLAIWLFCHGQTSAAPVHHPTAPTHHTTVKKG